MLTRVLHLGPCSGVLGYSLQKYMTTASGFAQCMKNPVGLVVNVHRSELVNE